MPNSKWMFALLGLLAGWLVVPAILAAAARRKSAA